MCKYYAKRKQNIKEVSIYEPIAIEELCKLAEIHKFCPYYLNMDRSIVADVIFMPYNYVIDEKIREKFSFPLKNSIIIFDEGHNTP